MQAELHEPELNPALVETVLRIAKERGELTALLKWYLEHDNIYMALMTAKILSGAKVNFDDFPWKEWLP
jgi:hypothetical protein